MDHTKLTGKKILWVEDDKFLSDIHLFKTLNGAHIGWFKKQKIRAETTLAFIHKQYRLQD